MFARVMGKGFAGGQSRGRALGVRGSGFWVALKVTFTREAILLIIRAKEKGKKRADKIEALA